MAVRTAAMIPHNTSQCWQILKPKKYFTFNKDGCKQSYKQLSHLHLLILYRLLVGAFFAQLCLLTKKCSNQRPIMKWEGVED